MSTQPTNVEWRYRLLVWYLKTFPERYEEALDLMAVFLIRHPEYKKVANFMVVEN